jgi:hypothetical protein
MFATRTARGRERSWDEPSKVGSLRGWPQPAACRSPTSRATAYPPIGAVLVRARRRTRSASVECRACASRARLTRCPRGSTRSHARKRVRATCQSITARRADTAARACGAPRRRQTASRGRRTRVHLVDLMVWIERGAAVWHSRSPDVAGRALSDGCARACRRERGPARGASCRRLTALSSGLARRSEEERAARCGAGDSKAAGRGGRAPAARVRLGCAAGREW